MKSHIGVDNYDYGQSIGRNETESEVIGRRNR